MSLEFGRSEIFVIARVRNDGSYFSYFFVRFAGGLAFVQWGGVRNSEVSADRESTVDQRV